MLGCWGGYLNLKGQGNKRVKKTTLLGALYCVFLAEYYSGD